MKSLLQGAGIGLAFVVVLAVVIWGVGKMFEPETTMIERMEEAHRRICLNGLRAQSSLTDSVNYAKTESCGNFLPGSR